MRLAPPKVLLFDLGGVVVDFRGAEGLHALTDGVHDLEDLRRNWWRLPELDGLERGRVTPEDFADAFMAQWRVSMPRDEFLDAFKHWVVGVIGEAPQLIADLAGDYRLACLSNLNPLHWERCVELGVDQLFADKFLSFEVGLRKPEPACYRLTVDSLGVAADEVLFFDDVEANVAAAEIAGLRAVLVEPDGGLKKALSAILKDAR